MFVIDSQVHIWGEETPERQWIPGGKDYAQLPIPFTAEDLIAAMDGTGVDRVVIVPPSWEGDRNDLTIEAFNKYPGRFGIMGRIAIHKPESRGLLAHWKDQPGMLGIRLTFARGQQLEWLTDGTADWFWPAAEAAGIPLMLFTPGSIPVVGQIAAKYPDIKLIMDHTGIEADGPHYGAVGPAVDEANKLAKYPNVAVKASAFPNHVDEGYPFPSLHDPIRRLVEAFGPERVFWGTDLTRSACTYDEALHLFTEAVPGLSEAERELIVGKAIANFLDWEI